jgi:hypothetical protein
METGIGGCAIVYTRKAVNSIEDDILLPHPDDLPHRLIQDIQIISRYI